MSLGFSTIEIMIALALMVVVLVGAIEAVMSAQYWFLSAQVANEALYKSKSIIEESRLNSLINFQEVSSTGLLPSSLPDVPADQSCISGGLCYYEKATVQDISSCAKKLTADVSSKLGLRYSTSSVTLTETFYNTKELVAVGSDCLITELSSAWVNSSPIVVASIVTPPQVTMGLDVMGEYIYTVSQIEPYLRIFRSTKTVPVPILVGSSSASTLRLNDIDVVRDLVSGRTYAYTVKHSTSSQLAVFDVTDPTEPLLITERPLWLVDSGGSFPQGWRVFVYGTKLYVVSRETTGPELHIFSLINPLAPAEETTAIINLNRTVNDMIVRSEIVGSTTRRFLYLAASSNLKEVGVYDVTDTVPVEVAAINLTGDADAMSLSLAGNSLFVGRRSSAQAELYKFDVPTLISGGVGLLATGEVGADVLTLAVHEPFMFLGTSKSSAQFQVWESESDLWSQTVANVGRLSATSYPNMPPLGFDVGQSGFYIIDQSSTLPETLSVFDTI